MKSCIFSHKVYPDHSPPPHLACLREHFAPLDFIIFVVLPLIWGPWGWATPFSLHPSAPTQAPTHLLLCVLKHFIFKDRWPRNTDFKFSSPHLLKNIQLSKFLKILLALFNDAWIKQRPIPQVERRSEELDKMKDFSWQKGMATRKLFSAKKQVGYWKVTFL